MKRKKLAVLTAAALVLTVSAGFITACSGEENVPVSSELSSAVEKSVQAPITESLDGTTWDVAEVHVKGQDKPQSREFIQSAYASLHGTVPEMYCTFTDSTMTSHLFGVETMFDYTYENGNLIIEGFDSAEIDGDIIYLETEMETSKLQKR